jgi:molybdopterin-containing oxidoreductase family membrane subunit
MMWWMSVFYIIYVTVITVEFINIKRNKHSKGLMWTAFIVAILTHSTLGALFGTIEQRFYYYSDLLPIYFLIIAFLTGSAIVSIVAAISVKQSPANDSSLLKPMRNFLGIGLGLAFLLTSWRLLIGIYGQAEGSHIFELTIWNQIIVGLFLATVLPFIMILYLKGPNGLIITGVFIMAVQLKTRLDLISGGFKIPLFRAYDIPEIISYTPSHVEFFILIACVSFVAFLYIFADKVGIFEFNQKREEI